jgi:hypothetical protein
MKSPFKAHNPSFGISATDLSHFAGKLEGTFIGFCAGICKENFGEGGVGLELFGGVDNEFGQASWPRGMIKV